MDDWKHHSFFVWMSWWRHQMETFFQRYRPFVRGIHRSSVNYPHRGQWRGALMFSLICVWINGWVNNRKAGDLRHYCVHCDVTVMIYWSTLKRQWWFRLVSVVCCHYFCMLVTLTKTITTECVILWWWCRDWSLQMWYYFHQWFYIIPAVLPGNCQTYFKHCATKKTCLCYEHLSHASNSTGTHFTNMV